MSQFEITPEERKMIKKEVHEAYQKGYIRTSIMQFSKVMKDELLKHLDRPGWKKESIVYLRHRLYEELRELNVAIGENKSKETITKECADVANFVMMISDVYEEDKEQP